jgi:peptide-methionine (S)-S-oxide reductase
MTKVYLGGGCFWCVEAVLKRVPGVTKVSPGYAGGKSKAPTYEEVCEGSTGHAEVIEVEYDEKKVSLSYLLEVFFDAHDPTTMNRQGNDVGTQYRSIILYLHDAEKKIISDAIKKAQGKFSEKIVTEVKPLEAFYAAEHYHFNYYDQNKNQPYCRYVILPKVEKIENKLKEKLK